jgi:Na+/H+ antiporter NhaD/arsenite permease-like protein
MNIPVAVLAAVGVLIAVRQVGKFRFQIWQVMVGGAVLVLLAGEISVTAAWRAVNLEVMFFLFGVFVVGQGLEESGYLAHIAYQYVKRSSSLDQLMRRVVFGTGLLSALLMNDTLAIVGTPVVLLLARKHQLPAVALLLTLAFAVTIGSVASPVGNPQNLVIALHGGIEHPFPTFFLWLLIPTVLNLYVTFLVMKWFYRAEWHEVELKHSQEPIRNHELAVLSRLSLRILILLIAVKTLTGVAGIGRDFQLPHIALASALPILVGSSRRWQILRHIDWHTLVFFAAMFVLMESVWQTGFFQSLLTQFQIDVRSTEMILMVSIVLSQFISNVPLVAFLQPLMLHAGASVGDLMALAAGSTVAGNMFILGAASNVIIIQNAEKRGGSTVSFAAFARIGVPLTLLNAAVYWAYFRLMGLFSP